MLDKHRKVFIFRFDLHVNSEVELHKVSELFQKVKRSCIQTYGSSFHYFWVREQAIATMPHYHVVLFMNGSVVQRSLIIQGWIKKHWDQHGYAHWAGVHNVERKHQKTIDKASEHISYLAKNRSKEKNPPASHNFGHSRFLKSKK
ncbi:inovirus-type Gp2 protein [Vibrio aestuarianus]|uniref:Inovirus-type Gp2 protein n=1 Tax=Vibrio aestuarianus TaxID=28171 RepID=A0AAX3U0N9_9VIBR|nr:inovirus-type Gp2 protein [Vibrio aestuarianus]WGK81036.1 inovirus-type Gp2 protein [Vibrio aestuarianus]